ncbi:hypothetical protein HDU67_009457, partial [Dinochytrium kinnereticum]
VGDGHIISSCGHVYCLECVTSYVNNHIQNGPDEEKGCPECRGPLDLNTLISIKDFKAKYDTSFKATSSSSDTVEEGLFTSSQQSEKMDLDDQWVSSTKIDRMVEILEAIRSKRSSDKVIVFSQFRQMLDLCEHPLRKRKFGFVRYDGSMTAEQRDTAVQTLQTDPSVTVILISLKCGSLGLNLTCANHVVLLDLWWNPAVENQAIDRVHRFGQTKEVSVHRIVIENTVEQRILQLQEQKQNMLNAALGEGGAKGLSNNRLGLGDLIKLFGANAEAESDDE